MSRVGRKVIPIPKGVQVQVKADRLVALKMILNRQYASLHEKVRFQIETETVTSARPAIAIRQFVSEPE